MKRHVCIVSETFAPEVNGVTLTLSHLVAGLSAHGHEISIVRPRQRKVDGLKCTPTVTTVSGLPLPGYPGLQFGLPAGNLLKQQWMRRRPDVVYTATEGPLGASAVRVARRLGIPVFSGFHTNFHSYSRHYGFGWLSRVMFRYLRYFHNRTRGTLVPSLDLRDRLLQMRFKNVSYVGRGVDGNLFDPAKRSIELRRTWGLSDRDVALLYVGRIAGEKNLQVAVDAYRAAKKVRDSVKFIVVGDGPLRRSFQAQHPDIVFCGLQLGDRLAAHYASGDIFLFPSETETFGNVTLEAMASGLAVVAYDYAAAGWHITGGETGILAPFGNAHAFVQATLELVLGLRLLQEIRVRARQYAASISWERVIERFEAVLFEDGTQATIEADSQPDHHTLGEPARGRM